MTENKGSFVVMVGAGINQICDKLTLTPFVRTQCIEMSNEVKPEANVSISQPIANAIACAIVSIVNRDAQMKGRVTRHLPDKMIGNVFGMTSISVVHNRHLINSVRGNNAKFAEAFNP
jgi:hypothetical protein